MSHLKLKEIRKACKMTQTELAKIMGVTLGTISSWERGITDMSLENVVKACHALNCSPNDLLGYEEYLASHPVNNNEQELLENYRSSDSANKAVLLTVAKNAAAQAEQQALEKKKSHDSDIGRESVA